MASKKGIAVTAIIVIAIAVASFSVWFVPQNTVQNITISDFENHIKGVENIHGILSDELDKSFQDLQEGKITVEQYNEIAETTSTQINSQIIQLVKSGASKEWNESYINYIEALRTHNSIIRETMVVADKIETQSRTGMDTSIDKINELRVNMELFIEASGQSKP